MLGESLPDVGPEEWVPLSSWPDALVCLVEDHGVGAHILQHRHRLNGVLPLCPNLWKFGTVQVSTWKALVRDMFAAKRAILNLSQRQAMLWNRLFINRCCGTEAELSWLEDPPSKKVAFLCNFFFFCYNNWCTAMFQKNTKIPKIKQFCGAEIIYFRLRLLSAPPLYIISAPAPFGSSFVHNFGSGSCHILPLKTVL